MSDLTSITIVRHGEKPDDSGKPPFGYDATGVQSDHGLTQRGWARARALADLLEPARPASPFLHPDHVLAPSFDGHELEHRPYLSAMPIAQACGTPIETPAHEGEEESLAKHVTHELTGNVFISWEHKHIPAMAQSIARELGVTDLTAHCSEWPDDDFSTALVFSQDKRTANGWRLQQVTEPVLSGS